MILIGQFDSPFVRRVGIALTLYGMRFDHKPWSTIRDGDKIAPFNPLKRVPTLVLPDGEVLIESHAILDYLDSLVPEDVALFARAEPLRRRQIKVASLATGLADKAVSLSYEKRLHEQTSALWEERCRSQIAAAVVALDQSLRTSQGPFWFGARFGHADIAAAVALRFVAEAHPGLIDLAAWPVLGAHAARMEALPVFAAVQQTFIAPA